MTDLGGGGGEQQDAGVKLAPFGVGVDCHSKFIQVCVQVQDGTTYRRYDGEFPSHWEDLKRAKTWLLAILQNFGFCRSDADLCYTLESTGCYHLPVCLAWAGQPSVVNPSLAAPSRRKTDVLDARLLAYHALTGLWPKTFLADSDLQTLRVTMAERNRFSTQATRSLNRVNNTLLRFGHTIASRGPLNRSDIRPVVEDLCRGRAGPPIVGISPIPLPPAVADIVLRCYTIYDESQAAARVEQKRAEALVRAWTYQTEGGPITGKKLLEILRTVPGVGPLTALAWLAQAADWRRFPNAKAAAAFAGSDPSLGVSAGHVVKRNRRRGNELLHHAVIQAAQYLVRTANEPIGMWGRRMWKNKGKGGWAKAVGAVARRIVQGMYWVHRKGEPFKYEGYRLDLPEVADVPLSEMGLSKRAQRLAEKHGWATSRDVASAALIGLQSYDSVGPLTASEFNSWLQENARWKADSSSREAS